MENYCPHCLYSVQADLDTGNRPCGVHPAISCPLAPNNLAARDALYAELSPLIRRLIRQYGRTAELRQDLTGELFSLFHTYLDRFDPSRGIPLRFYLIRQMTAGAYTFARKHWRQSRREVSLAEEMESGGRLPSLDPTEEWDNRIQLRHRVEMLPELIHRLPTRQRQVVEWRYYENRSSEEIARQMGIEPASVRSLLRHGLNALRQKIAAGDAPITPR
jgi:RNA polymerase sigma factor (sigma-70 family)